MISRWKAREVKRLLQAGLSHRTISEQTGVARSTVSSIRKGHWDAALKRRIEKAEDSKSSYRYPSLGGGHSGRCSECGATVFLPCHACWVRKQKSKRQS